MEMSDDEPSEADMEVVGRIERYLDAHPHAADSAAGVAQWWLAGTYAGVEDVKTVLEWLAERGRLGQRQVRDGTTVYFRADSAGQ